MVININGKDYRMYFGFDFIDYINQKDGLSAQGLQLGLMGTRLLTVGLDGKQPSALRTIVKAGTVTLPQQPSNQDIELWINELIEDGNKYDEIFEEIIEELGKHLIVLREMGITKKEWDEARAKDKMIQELEKE